MAQKHEFQKNMFLEDCSVFSHEMLYRWSWYYSNGYYVKAIFSYVFCWGPFLSIFDHKLSYIYLFFENR